MSFLDRDRLLNDIPEHPSESWLFELIQTWVDADILPFKMGVLATVDKHGLPMSRTVAVREINAQGLLFFTQGGSSKVAQLEQNPKVSFTFMLANTQRQITLLGTVTALSKEENQKYWDTYEQERRLRFLVYGTRSGQPAASQQALDDEVTALKTQYGDTLPEMPAEYVGYRILPTTIKFYQLNDHRISDSLAATKENGTWNLKRFVP